VRKKKVSFRLSENVKVDVLVELKSRRDFTDRLNDIESLSDDEKAKLIDHHLALQKDNDQLRKLAFGLLIEGLCQYDRELKKRVLDESNATLDFYRKCDIGLSATEMDKAAVLRELLK